MAVTEYENIAIEHQVLKTLLYFDVFNYPLNKDEVFRFAGITGITETDIHICLENLVAHHLIYRHEEFYCVQPPRMIVQRRLKGNKRAQEVLPVAFRQAVLISKFPFVRGVLASGSLSKNFMDEHSDIDFFIVTAPKRLWIARTLLVMYKRIFLFNSHKHFCINYFVDEDHLEIEEKNLFTATELATILPLYNPAIYAEILARNEWLKTVFPNFQPRRTDDVKTLAAGNLKKIFEGILNLFAMPLENIFMQITLNRWKKIYQKNYSEADFDVAFKTKTYASKNHPKLYQQKAIELHENKIRDFFSNHQLTTRP
jgi:hypothetical protein